MSFCAPSLVDGQRELAPVAPPGSRSGLCATGHRYVEGRLLAEDACRRTAVRPGFWFADFADGLMFHRRIYESKPQAVGLNRSQQLFTGRLLHHTSCHTMGV